MRRTHRAQRTPDPSLTPLLVRAGAARTLGSIVTFIALALLCFGVYTLVEAIHHPLEAQATEIIAAAVMIALAATMVFFLFEPGSSPRLARHRHAVGLCGGAHAIPTPALDVLPLADAQDELPFTDTLAERTSTGN
jgi:hypothetical protein